MKRLRQLTLATVIASVSACSIFEEHSKVAMGPTLADVEPAVMPDPTKAVPEISLSEIEAYYQTALTTANRPETRRKILIRLAGLEMVRSENELVESEVADGNYFDNAITMYQELIDLQRAEPQGVGRGTSVDELLYQLSKAYALDGQTDQADATLDQIAREFPNSPYLAEAFFRRAERSFSQEDYRQSSARYEAVVAAGPKSEFYENALYMLGWSQFKRGVYEDALDTFTQLLDVYLKDGSELSSLTGSARTLCEDTLRVMSLSFSYLDGAATIEDTFTRTGRRDYEHLLYAGLADLYFSKQRFTDSANTYQRFVDLNPLNTRSPEFSLARVKVFEEGGFPEKVVDAKRAYILRYGITSEYWAAKTQAEREPLLATLHGFLTELAQFRHARAQQWQQTLAKNPKQKFNAENKPVTPERINAEYNLAAQWYREFLATFPEDPTTATMNYLLAEALYASGQTQPAYVEFHKVAYFLDELLTDAQLGADAGYNAFLFTQELYDAAVEPDLKAHWQEQNIYNGLLFSDLYQPDPRALNVLIKSAQGLLDTGQNLKAVEAAMRATQWEPTPEGELQITAWLIIAQAQFNAADYNNAEVAYQEVLGLLPANDPRRDSINERLAASLYKRAELSVARGDMGSAVEQLLQVKARLPNSDIARTAHYDAANYLVDLGRHNEARNLLLEYRSQYPKDPLTANIGSKLVVVYQALENWSGAATELRGVMRTDKDPEFQRQSTYLVAELYEKADNKDQAIEFYRNYAHRYPVPFADNIEAQQKLAELYKATNDTDKRNFWLRKLISSHDSAKTATPRSLYLAAWSANDLAEQHYQSFSNIKLKLPLKTSLKRKKNALEIALRGYEKTLSYGVEEFTTKSNYRIGDIYATLSRDLMQSQRPKGLSELELEQYEILLEEQALPFEDQAIKIHTANSQRSWLGIYDEWVKDSFTALAKLLPGRYDKPEQRIEVSDEIY